jgi:DNA-binding PadR family transcriptional regulator
MSRRRFPDPDDLERFAAVRHVRGGPPFAPDRFFFGAPVGGGRGRKRRGDVRAALLLLLAEEPRNGYQLMQIIEERSGGRWRPSPGSVYPTLAQLEDEGFVRAVEQGDAKLFEVTDAGRQHLADRGHTTPPWDDGGDEQDVPMRKLIGQIAAAAMQVVHMGDEAQVKQAGETLIQARRTLYRILAEEDDV